MIVKVSSVVFCPTAALLPQDCCLRKFLRSPQKLRAQATFLGAQNKIRRDQSLGLGGRGEEVREDVGRGWSELWKSREVLGAEIFHETLNMV